MKSRLVAAFATLIASLVVALAVPLGLAYASHRTDRLLLDRRADATRFAYLADQAVRDGDRSVLAAEITRYAELYGAAVRVRDRGGEVLVEAGVMASDDRDAVRLALSGRTTEVLPPLTAFGPPRVLVAEPAGRDAQLSGVVVLETPAGRASAEVAVVWGGLGAAAVAAFGCSMWGARRLARWIMRPVTELDRTTRAIAEGRLDARAGAGTGPSELRRLEERFNVMAEAVSVAMERQRAFVADASHELRTPLTVLSLRLENLEPHVRESGAVDYGQAMAEIGRLAGLVEDLLALAKVEAGAVPRVVEAVAELAPRLEGWREVYAASGLRLVGVLPESQWVMAVPGAVGRVVDIALDNAHKFVPAGGTVTVTLEGAVTLEEAVLRVADDGPGLRSDELEVASGRFWRSGSHVNVRGSGLGLAIAAELARVSGGSLEILPVEPCGLAVELRLLAACGED
ncbi:Signal transduction histidine kinase [Sinosporangium album]|uniref:histidine kinase n=1 Tax=Sinosporangium album TaxID=504805 RepID=A0A1G7WR18_9ACTN|nr:HAMP domain-containing sensor histidine kinase [Sinosporangium album]SDG74324.1 Signal transduction histidine kinase [Sinosporangium album]